MYFEGWMSSCERLLTRVFFLFFYEQFDNHCFCLFVCFVVKKIWFYSLVAAVVIPNKSEQNLTVLGHIDDCRWSYQGSSSGRLWKHRSQISKKDIYSCMRSFCAGCVFQKIEQGKSWESAISVFCNREGTCANQKHMPTSPHLTSLHFPKRRWPTKSDKDTYQGFISVFGLKIWGAIIMSCA